MAEFKKYSEIDNSYAFKLEDFSNVPNFSQIKFLIQDKIDGSNISFIFDEHGFCKLASRTKYLGHIKNVTFQGIQEAIAGEHLQDFIKHFSEVSKSKGIIYQFYGEVFGPSIQKRCYYGPKIQVRFFDLRIGEHYVTQKEFYSVMEEAGFRDLIVPDFGFVVGLFDALAFNETFKDPLSGDSTHFLGSNKENYGEGIVIKPWSENVVNKYGERFIFKKKSAKFSEKSPKGPKVKKEKEELPESLAAMRDEFLRYINENRVLSCFSKQGKIEKMSQIGKYIPVILEDAEKDFLKDNAMTSFGKEERKVCFNAATPIVVDFLKKAISGEWQC